jgi:hypothetical protein
VSHESGPRDFDYTLVTMYLPKGICAVRPQQDKITTLKFNDFNLGNRKNHSILSSHRYLTRMKGKSLRIIPQPWTMNLTWSTILNVIKIPHFERHQEVNACFKLLLSCYHDDYLWLDRHITVDPTFIHRITGLSIQGPYPHDFYLGKATGHALAQDIKDTYGNVEKRM